MPDNDLLHRFIFDDNDIRGELVTLNESYQTVLAHNNHSQELRHLLGQFLAAAALLSSTLKFDGTITIQARGEGGIGLIMAECTNHNNLRGILRLNAEKTVPVQNNDLQTLMPNGMLAITITPDKGLRHQGIVPLDCDTLAQCLEQYFTQSEQIDTRIWLAVGTNNVAGMLIQALPRQLTENESVNQEQWETITTLAATVRPEELLNLPHETLLFRLFHEFQLKIFAAKTLQFSCQCSFERSATALTSLGKEEALLLLQEQGTIEIDCQFCNQVYRFDRSNLQTLFDNVVLH